MYKPEASSIVVNPETPAAKNRPCFRTRQLGLEDDQFLKCPDSTLIPTNSNISPTAKQILR